ncbi:MAG: cytochrome c nitrite reductase small subunit [Deltaproteobacteria bacterium RIFOXYD12_FULL_57_12]|nr:MAG: cytochrome c nitrite reductase small subunit [Deltaproteobacteria bacterium RIFOXYD12_FULL_57_12]
MGDKKKRIGLYGLAVLGAGLVVALFLLLGPPKLLAESESPVFCAGCHVMEAEYEAWDHAGAHRRIKCVDCHLPNEGRVLHYTWKSIDGMKDVLVFYSGKVPERIAITNHGKEVVQGNCIRCHETTVGHIDQERLCWDCHRRIAHRRSGSMQTL